MSGEIITIGKATLYHGDCREILPTLPKVDLVLTDPPYGLAEKLQGGTWGKQFEGAYKDWDAVPAQHVTDAIAISDKSIVWGGNYFSLPPSRCWMVWYKRDAVPTMAQCELAWASFDANAKVFDWTIAATNAERVDHPTQKPIALMEWCLSLAKNTLTVADPFMGSGTTGVACANMGKTFYGIERERKYFDIACERIENAYRQERLIA